MTAPDLQADNTPEQADSHSFSPAVTLLPGLYLVATPIGNLRDISLRALDILRAVDAIACEDTRVSQKLLQYYQIRKPLVPYHDHNADQQRPQILAQLAVGQKIALISDAGMPLIADPGYKLVRDAVAAGHMVTSAPGANAVLTALQLSALPSDRFAFLGFLPPKSTARRKILAGYAAWPVTLVFYEGVSRLPDTLADMVEVLGGDRPAAVLRELTKLYEEGRRDTLADLARYYHDIGAPKGEVVIVIGPGTTQTALDDDQIDDLLRLALAGASLRDAVAQVMAQTGLPRKQIYPRALALRDGDDEENS